MLEVNKYIVIMLLYSQTDTKNKKPKDIFYIHSKNIKGIGGTEILVYT